MIRLTAVLVACLYAAFVIWGGDASDADVPVARAEPLSVPGIGTEHAVTAAAQADDGGTSMTEQEAIEVALAAGEHAAPPAKPASSGPAATAATSLADTDVWYVTGTRVNLRSAPSSNAPVVGGVSLGERAEVLSDPSASWVRIRTERGLEAWIFGRFLSETPA